MRFGYFLSVEQTTKAVRLFNEVDCIKCCQAAIAKANEIFLIFRQKYSDCRQGSLQSPP